MASYNRVVIMGNLTRDPDYRQLPSGQGICKLGLAVNRQFKNRQTGSMVQEVCYIDIEVWGAQAESCKQYLQKGRPVLVEGRLKFDTWEDQSGGTRSKHSIVADRVLFLGTAAGAESDFDAASSENSFDGSVRMDKDLMAEIDKAQSKIRAATAKPRQSSVPKSKSLHVSSDDDLPSIEVGGSLDFKDEPPFEDDLPF